MKRLFSQLMGRAAAPEADADDLHLAAAALLYEVARADGQIDPRERDTLLTKLAARWDLPRDQVVEKFDAAEEAAEQATDYFQFTRPLREHWSADERRALIHDMWSVAHADGKTHPQEEYVIRKVADLLYVAHSDFIRARHATQPDND
ncbi:TerB family tellurite resistance protein [Isoalcanivorax indicus]|uniref:tellurite resistance TerB family protein n=1 Tax=Isoalcanivorax indicus TaxID=2202653 RepID=UPI000DBA7BA1|nr:TerB family tellurite resistance protein [Isoalcanivorax indicus]